MDHMIAGSIKESWLIILVLENPPVVSRYPAALRPYVDKKNVPQYSLLLHPHQFQSHHTKYFIDMILSLWVAGLGPRPEEE